jgi:hypothetical protein
MMKIDTKDLAYITEQGKELGINPAALLAIIEVESNGVIGNPHPIIRWEGHYFDRLVPAKLRDTARAQKLSSPKAGSVKNPKGQTGRYDILNKAVLIDKEAAYSSISIGVGQVMGAHAKDLGYPSAEAMFNRAKQGLSGQVELMLRFIKFNKLVDELQRLDWSAFARAYNGPNYRANAYHTKMKEAFERYAGVVITPTKGSAANMIRMGSKGAKVREIQALLVRAGFTVKVDGDFGPSTRDAVKAFQIKYKLEADGVVGPATQKELLTWKTDPAETVGQPKPNDIGGVKAGTNLGIFAGILLMVQQFFNSAFDKGIVIVAIALLLIAGFWALDAWQKSKLTYEGIK